jgi:hypothetical protein
MSFWMFGKAVNRDKSFIKRIIPVNRASPTSYEQPLIEGGVKILKSLKI